MNAQQQTDNLIGRRFPLAHTDTSKSGTPHLEYPHLHVLFDLCHLNCPTLFASLSNTCTLSLPHVTVSRLLPYYYSL